MKKRLVIAIVAAAVSACSLDDDGDRPAQAKRDGVFAVTFAQAFSQEPNDAPVEVNDTKPETLDKQSFDGFIR